MNFMWECECGNIEFSDVQPPECGKCFRIESFAKVPEEMEEEKKEKLIKSHLKNKIKRKENENNKKKKV